MTEQFQRDSFFGRIYELAAKDKDLVIVVADMSAPALDKFRTNLPAQFINVGIAEQNAIQVASGLAMAGKKVLAYAISPFITLRALEQIRVSNGIMGIPITIVGMGTGLSYENDGPTHHLIEDISIMRAIPRVNILNITDSAMAGQAADIAYNATTTTYIRLDKDKYPDLHGDSLDMEQGMKTVREGDQYVLLCTGPITHSGLKVARKISEERRVSIKVVDVFSIPVNAEALKKQVAGAKMVFTLEEHFLPGGFGSAVCEIFADHRIAVPVTRIGMSINDGFKFNYKYGGREVIQKHYGIDADGIERQMLAHIAER